MAGIASNPFALPQGQIGWIASKLMAWGSRELNAPALEALDVQPGNHVLEIGCGPGTTLPTLAVRVGDGFVTGIEP